MASQLIISFHWIIEYVDFIYPTELEIKGYHRYGLATLASYLDLHIEINSENKLRKNITREDSILPLWIFHLWVTTIQAALVYEVYISQLLCYCCWYFRKLNTVIFYIKFVIYKCQLICDCIKQQIVTIVKSNMMNFIKYFSFCDKRSAVY